MNHSIMFFDRDNKGKLVPASFSFFFRTIMREKQILTKKCVMVITVIILCIIKKLTTLFYILCSCKKVVEKSN